MDACLPCALFEDERDALAARAAPALTEAERERLLALPMSSAPGTAPVRHRRLASGSSAHPYREDERTERGEVTLEEAAEALKMSEATVWEASDQVCSKRLKPLVPVLLPALKLPAEGDVGAGNGDPRLQHQVLRLVSPAISARGLRAPGSSALSELQRNVLHNSIV